MAHNNAPMPGAPADFVYRRMRESILRGVLTPGSVISQVQVAAEFGVSRSPLREALSRLAGEGLVTSDYNRRARVSELDLDDFDQLYAIRLSVEPIAMTMTIGALTESDYEYLRTSVAKMDECIDGNDMSSFHIHHRNFHLGLIEHDDGRLTRLIEDLWDHSDRYRAAYLHYATDAGDERIRIAQDEHHAMLDAAESRDAALCTRIHRTHLSRTLNGVFRDEHRIPRWSTARDTRA